MLLATPRPSTVRALSVAILGWVAVLLSVTGPAVAVEIDDAKTIHLVSLDWPPYTISADSDAGASQQVVHAAFAAMGYRVVTDYVPWQRAVDLGLHDPRYMGYYPEYKTPDTAGCRFSDPIGVSPLGLASRKQEGLVGKTLDQLKGIPIGTVRGYVNTAEFDGRVKDGRLTVEPATYDVFNLRKMVLGHLKIAVIDKNVMAYLIATDPDLKGKGDLLAFDNSAMADQPLYVCFRADDAGQTMVTILDSGLKKIDSQAIINATFQKAMQ